MDHDQKPVDGSGWDTDGDGSAIDDTLGWLGDISQMPVGGGLIAAGTAIGGVGASVAAGGIGLGLTGLGTLPGGGAILAGGLATTVGASMIGLGGAVMHEDYPDWTHGVGDELGDLFGRGGAEPQGIGIGASLNSMVDAGVGAVGAASDWWNKEPEPPPKPPSLADVMGVSE